MTEDIVASGIKTLPSPYPVAETLDRLEAVVRGKNMTIFARIDQRAAAEGAGLTLRPTQLLIFGDPKSGTPLMDKYPSLALDLPLKALAWEAAGGQVWLSYNDPEYLARRHGLDGNPFGGVNVLVGKALE